MSRAEPVGALVQVHHSKTCSKSHFSKKCKTGWQSTSKERGELVSVCGIVSATGVALPPVLVLPRVNYPQCFMNGALEGSLGLNNPFGWMNGNIFLKVFEHIVKFTLSTVIILLQ